MFRMFSIVVVFTLSTTLWGNAVKQFSDITLWTGSGPNEAALVIDWDGDDPDNTSLVWGYRWSGTATSEDMLRAVVAADARLFAKISPAFSFGIGIYGLGYDVDGDGFGVTDGTVFGPGGLAVSGSPDDSNIATDGDDLYREGFFAGFWNVGLSLGNPYDGGSWESAQTGVSGETLTSGDWNSLAFTVTFDNVFASNPCAAVPEASTMLLTAVGFILGGWAFKRRS